MTIHPVLRGVVTFAAAVVLAACATTEPGPSVAVVEPSTSSAQADARLAAVAVERASIEARFAEREAVCYNKFFVNSCLDEAKERRRAALVAQRNIEIEAERFKRRLKVEERDREIAAADAEYKAEEAALAAQPPAPPPRDTTAVPPPRPSPAASRIARRNAKAQEAAARAPQEAARAAASAAAFEERKRKSEQRQRDVAARKAEREAKAAAKKTNEAAKAAAPVGK